MICSSLRLVTYEIGCCNVKAHQKDSCDRQVPAIRWGLKEDEGSVRHAKDQLNEDQLMEQDTPSHV